VSEQGRWQQPRRCCVQGLLAGLHVSEQYALRVDELELNARLYSLIYVRLGKGMRARTIALEKKVAQALKNYLVQRGESLSDVVFLNHYENPWVSGGPRKI
jgi:site-specific recombinase XerD